MDNFIFKNFFDSNVIKVYYLIRKIQRPVIKLSVISYILIVSFQGCSSQVNYDKALMKAIINNDIAGVEDALKNNANVNINCNIHESGIYYISDTHNTPLTLAVFKNNIDICKLLIKSGADVNKADGSHGFSLSTASMFGYYDIVELLLKSNANVNVQYGYSYTPLMLASKNCHVSVVGLLMKYGANPNPVARGATPIGVACENCPGDKKNKRQIYRLIQKEDPPKNILYY